MHEWLGNSFKAQEIDKSRSSTGRSSMTGGELGGKAMCTIERGAKIDSYEDAEMSFYFDWTYARDGCNEMERDGAEKSSKQECELFLHTS